MADDVPHLVFASARMFQTPVLECAQHRPELAALGGEQIFGARGVLLVEAPLDQIGLLQSLEAGRTPLPVQQKRQSGSHCAHLFTGCRPAFGQE